MTDTLDKDLAEYGKNELLHQAIDRAVLRGAMRIEAAKDAMDFYGSKCLANRRLPLMALHDSASRCNRMSAFGVVRKWPGHSGTAKTNPFRSSEKRSSSDGGRTRVTISRAKSLRSRPTHREQMDPKRSSRCILPLGIF